MIKLRHLGKNDDMLIEKWLNLDPEHSQTSTPDFWLPPKDPDKQHKGVKYLAVEDDIGVIGYLVLENCVRIHAQFAPPAEIERTRAATAEVMVQIQKWAHDQYKEIILKSESPGLLWFLRKFGFRGSKNEVICRL